MKGLYKLERKFGKYAISNLPLYVVIVFSISYILELFLPDVYQYVIFSPYHIFAEHEYWRIFTWVFTTPGNFSFFTLVMLFCYYNIGVLIERAIGTFMFNLYIFGGFIFSTVGAVFSSLIVYLSGNEYKLMYEGLFAGLNMTYYFCISIMLIFGMVYSDSMMLFMFVLPIKAGILAVMDAIWLAYYFFKYDSLVNKVVIVSCVLNAIIWYFMFYRKRSYKQSITSKLKRKNNLKRKRNYSKEDNVIKVDMTNPKGITRHKCAVCGRSEKDDLSLEFRFCSKCKGNYEYCSEHIFTHEHVN